MSESNEGMYRFLVWLALATFLIVVGVMLYQYLFGPGDRAGMEYRRGNLRLEDGEFEEALRNFEAVLQRDPGNAPSHLGRALALMGQQRNEEAMAALEQAIALAPGFAAGYANRGILKDRLAHPVEALADYRKALALDPELGEGPGWLTRFFRLQYDRPPTIADRARYLEAELKKPPGERKLVDPGQDALQRSYKFEGDMGATR